MISDLWLKVCSSNPEVVRALGREPVISFTDGEYHITFTKRFIGFLTVDLELA